MHHMEYRSLNLAIVESARAALEEMGRVDFYYLRWSGFNNTRLFYRALICYKKTCDNQTDVITN